MDIIKQKDENYPKQLLQLQNPPKQIYVKGDSSLLAKNAIAIVGSRKCTLYGEKYAKQFSMQLAKKGITIISGMAIGIDSIAHSYAMKELGKTIAVLGTGFNYICPKQNEYLYQQILANGGCVISEYSPEVQENKANYPRRNRIISGLSMGVLVIEAKARSGSTITANLAKKQNKEVFCIPHKLDEKNGHGTNLLIKNGANLVTCPEDVLAFYEWEDNSKRKKNKIGLEEKIAEENSLTDEEQKVYEVIGQLPISPNEIAKMTNLSISQVMESLCILEIKEKIKSLAGNQYISL